MKKSFTFADMKPYQPYLITVPIVKKQEVICFFDADPEPKYPITDSKGSYYNDNGKKVYAHTVGESPDTMVKAMQGTSTSGLVYMITVKENDFDDMVKNYGLMPIDKTHPLYNEAQFKTLASNMEEFEKQMKSMFGEFF